LPEPSVSDDWIASAAAQAVSGLSPADVQASVARQFPDLDAASHDMVTARVLTAALALMKPQIDPSAPMSDGQMFHIQFMMEMMSQYIEAVSNTLQAVHNEMITMARATKGQ
jgi:hypothetical protein